MTNISELRHNLVKDKRGNVAIIFALMIVPIFGATGIGIEYGRALSTRQVLQNAADAATIGAAKEVDLSSSEKRAQAEKIFKANTQDDALASGTIPSVSVDGDKVTITVDITLPGPITHAIGMQGLDISVKSAAIGGTDSDGSSGSACVLALSQRAQDAIYLNGTTDYVAINCATYSNSDASNSLHAFGNSTATGSKFCTRGGVDGASHFSPAPRTGCSTIADPLADVPEPSSAYCSSGDKALTLKKGNHSLSPGTYCGGLTVMAHAKVTFQPGVYVIKNGPLEFRSQSESSGQGVVFHFTGSNTSLLLLGGADVNFKAPTSGSYAGIVFNQNPASNSGATTKIQGGGNVKIVGMIHLPTQIVQIGGNGDLGQQSDAWAIIADQVHLKGNGQIRIKADFAAQGLPDVLPKTPSGGAQLIF